MFAIHNNSIPTMPACPADRTDDQVLPSPVKTSLDIGFYSPPVLPFETAGARGNGPGAHPKLVKVVHSMDTSGYELF